MSLAAGARIGAYDVVGPLGAGGMGEVWRARDSRLGREVALKILPSAFAADPSRLGRFEREAKLLASLSHPNVATLFGLEQLGGQRVLVMELAEGEDLSHRIRRGPIPLDEALSIALQTAQALEEAHEKGIVHRDLKPANVKIAPDGKVKVLDFGLAKAWGGDDDGPSSADLSSSPTLTRTGTVPGVILGTAGYMAPEQAAGRPVDRRADVWAFGVVLFEVLTGRRLFVGETASEVLASVIKGEPDWSQLPANLPPGLVRLLGRCLRKKPRERLRDMGDVRLELEDLISGGPAAERPPQTAAAAPAPRLHRPLLAGATVALAAGLAGAAAGYLHRPAPDARVLEFEIVPPAGTSFYVDNPGEPGVPVISPDGRQLAFTAEGTGGHSLYVRSLGSAAPRLIRGTENAEYPFWSPDSRQVGFFARGKLMKVQAGGDAGPPLEVCAAGEMKGASWGKGVIVFAPDATSGLSRVAEGGGDPVALTRLDPARNENSHRHPRFLPDGRRFLYLARLDGTADHAIMLGSLDGGPVRELLRSPAAAEYASGHLLFVRDRTLLARPFDPDRFEFRGEAFPLVDDVRLVAVGPGGTALGVFSASAAGLLAFQKHLPPRARRLVWRDAQGRVTGTFGDEALYDGPRISPRGDRAAVEIVEADVSGASRGDIWLVDLVRNVRSRFTFGAGEEGASQWLPDGSGLVFACESPAQVEDVCRQNLDSSEPQVLLESKESKVPSAISPDGRWLLFSRRFQTAPSRWDLELLPLQGREPRHPTPWLKTGGSLSNGRFSPDGRYVAYASDESGRVEVYVTAFPGPVRKWAITTSGGSHPDWQADGRRLFYRAPDGTTKAVTVTSRGDGLEFGPPQPLFRIPLIAESSLIAPGPDSKRILSVEPTEADAAPPVSVVVNWPAWRGR